MACLLCPLFLGYPLLICFKLLSAHEKEISEQLVGFGLTEGRDFISYKDYCRRDIPLELVQQTIRDSLIGEDNGELTVKVYGKSQYEEIVKKYKMYEKFEKALGSLYRKLPGRMGGYVGQCAACRKTQTFVVDYVWSKGLQPAWRETVTCPECNCNSRMRFVIDYMKKIEKDKTVFVYEAVTNMYRELKKGISYIQGSEYLGEEFCSGQIVNGIMHQDALALGFPDESFDYMVSSDVLEHVADFRLALRESWRCLKSEGHLLISIPIFKDREKTLLRTRKDRKGELEYLLPPVYHGNPLSAEGSLVFTEFGWDILEELKKAGFREAYAIVYFSVEKGYFGNFPVIFEAVK